MKKRVLLLNPPYPEPIIRDNYCCFTSKSGYQWAPTDLLYISGILNGDKRFTVQIIDASGERASEANAESRIQSFQPEIVCCLTGTVSFEQDMTFLQSAVRNLPKKPRIFVMGNTPCFAPQRFLRQFPFLTGVLHNFMDKRLVYALLGKPHLCSTCSYRKGGAVKVGAINLPPKQKIADGINPPLYSQFPIHKYTTPIIKNKPFITAMTAFGCPFTCSFCIASRLNYHTRDLQELEAEFKAMKKAGIREIFFIDSTFNANPPFVDEVLEMMIKNKFGFTWSAQIHSFRVTQELIRKMRRAGCHTVQIGVESGSQAILKEYAPSKYKDKIASAVQTCKKEGMRVLGYFIIGFPKESRQQALETIKYAKELDPEFASFSTMTPDYGTKVYDEALKAKAFTDTDNEPLSAFDSSGKAILHNTFLSPKEQDSLVRKAYVNFYLNPFKIFTYMRNVNGIGKYIRNGIFLIKRKMINLP